MHTHTSLSHQIYAQTRTNEVSEEATVDNGIDFQLPEGKKEMEFRGPQGV